MGDLGAELYGCSHREPTRGEQSVSSSLRSDGSCGGQAGSRSGRAIAQQGPKTLKGRAGKQLQAARGLNQTRAKGSPLEKYCTTTQKELLTLSRGMMMRGVPDDDDEREPQ